MPDIISVGECMIELFAEKPIGEADIFSRSLAGDTLHILVAAQRLGSTTGYITLVGRDPFTDYLLDTWMNESIDTSRVKIVNGFNAETIYKAIKQHPITIISLVPTLLTKILELPTPTNPLGVRGGGEGGTTPALAVIVNAIVDALGEYGVTHIEMPATPERIWRAINHESN